MTVSTTLLGTVLRPRAYPVLLLSFWQTEGDEIVLNGRKWWTSGAMDPRCKVAIFMGRQMDAIRNGAPRHQQHSMVLVPMDHPGVSVRDAACRLPA